MDVWLPTDVAFQGDRKCRRRSQFGEGNNYFHDSQAMLEVSVGHSLSRTRLGLGGGSGLPQQRGEGYNSGECKVQGPVAKDGDFNIPTDGVLRDGRCRNQRLVMAGGLGVRERRAQIGVTEARSRQMMTQGA